ncbi:MAG: Z1 domain-containing protein [Aestuariivirga sp.]
MSSVEENIAAMAVMTLRMRHPTEAVGRPEIEKAVRDCARMADGALTEQQIASVISELEKRLVVKVGRATTLVDGKNHVPWYFGKAKENRRFFKRYAEFLLQDQKWSPATIDALDAATDLIMEQIENPEREGPWDRRGLVVGHVQSGKTANYAGLANKAADAGYKLIIVLAGMHNALRQQTQRRLDRDILGYDTSRVATGQGAARIGVGELDRNIHAEYLTTQDASGDFSRARADNQGMGVQHRPVLLVVKKNSRILENLNTWVNDTLKRLGDTESRPLLVIDDEADQASVDTGQQDYDDDDTPDPDYEPKRINGQIRRLLAAFDRSAYVAYTATPFANILIHDAATAEGFGDDLFPRSFIVNLPAPSNYVGPSLIFGLDSSNGADAELPLGLIRHINQDEEDWIETGHKKGYVPLFDGEACIPPSLEDAILTFVLACAARSARGQENAHNSMLVHVSRFTDVHQHVFSQIEEWFGNLRRILKHRTGGARILARLETLWLQDFEPTSASVRRHAIGADLPTTSWDEVRERLSSAADKIKLQVVNSDLKDALPYEQYEKQGLGYNVIAIGGDKLSRGLTLEGLTVSYFLRASRMYDSLLQMGRWFGYRPGYVDLCRLFLPRDLELWFRHVATAAEELRERLDHMAMIGSTPEQYGFRIQSHDILLVTAQNKMRYAREFQVSFQGQSKIQTIFPLDETTNRRNADTITALLDRLPPPTEPATDSKDTAVRRIWRNVPGAEIASLVDALNFPPNALDFSSKRLGPYIREQIRASELTDWTVAVLVGDEEALPHNGWLFGTIKRTPLEEPRKAGLYVVKSILSPSDEALDLSPDQVKQALEWTNARRREAGERGARIPSGPDIRRVRGQNPRQGLLLIYPLSPKRAAVELPFPIFGIVLSFPDSSNGRAVRYRFNTVEQRVEPA